MSNQNAVVVATGGVAGFSEVDAAGVAIDIERTYRALSVGYSRFDSGSFVTGVLTVPDHVLAGLDTVPALDNPYTDEALRGVIVTLQDVALEDLKLGPADAYNTWRERVNEYGAQTQLAGLLLPCIGDKARIKEVRANYERVRGSSEWRLPSALFRDAAMAIEWPNEVAVLADGPLSFYHWLNGSSLPCVAVRVKGREGSEVGDLAVNLGQVALHLDLPVKTGETGSGSGAGALHRMRERSRQ